MSAQKPGASIVRVEQILSTLRFIIQIYFQHLKEIFIMTNSAILNHQGTMIKVFY